MNDMASLPKPTLTVIEQSHISPPPSTLRNRSLPFTFFDYGWVTSFPDPVHTLFFYDLPITNAQFTETIVHKLKESLSITLQHFFPFVGNLVIFPSRTKKPEIRYVEGDYVEVTFAECDLDFNDLTGNHPRDCDKFYHLIPLLGRTRKVSDYIAIPVFAVQVTLFPNCGISIGMTNHHSLGDASTRFCFLKAWTSIARSGTDESFLSNGTLPVYDRAVINPKLEEDCLKNLNVEIFNEEYQLPRLSGPSNKVRATFVLTRTVINGLKKLVSTQIPTLPYVSSFTVSCACIWSCMASLHNDELSAFGFIIDCRSRIEPPLPAAYFGNCLSLCINTARTNVLTGKEGFVTAANLIGENLHKILTDKDGVVKDLGNIMDLFPDGLPTLAFGVAGTPKLKFYDLDFGFGKPKKHETISIDYNDSISISSCKDSNDDLEIGVCLSAPDMKSFVNVFNVGLETYL